MPSIFAYYGSISKNEARRRLENSPEFVASVIDQIAYEMSWHLKTRTVREHIYMVVPEEKLVKNVDIVDGMSGKIRTLGLEKMIMQLYEVLQIHFSFYKISDIPRTDQEPSHFCYRYSKQQQEPYFLFAF